MSKSFLCARQPTMWKRFSPRILQTYPDVGGCLNKSGKAPEHQGCAHFAAILVARTHCQFLHKRCSFISHRPFIVESCNSCRVDDRFVGTPLEKVKISAKRAHLRDNVIFGKAWSFTYTMTSLLSGFSDWWSLVYTCVIWLKYSVYSSA